MDAGRRTEREPTSSLDRRLTSSEFGDAGVLAALAALLVAVGKLAPHLGAVEAASVVPFVVLGARNRSPVVVSAAIAGAAVAVLIAGIGAAFSIFAAATGGGLVGALTVRRWGVGAVGAVTGLIGAALGGVADLALVLLPATRDLVLGSTAASVTGLVRILQTVPSLAAAAASLAHAAQTALTWWALLIPLGALAAGAVAGGAVRLVTPQLLARVLVPPVDPLTHDRADGDAPGPLPVRLTDVRLRHPGGTEEALGGVTLEVQAGELIVVTGANGSGKSTLLRCLAGVQPTSGRVERPGGAGLGRPGGTAMILQRPETQVIGSTVGEDLRWALPEASGAQIDAALAEVGLAGLGRRPTSTLSGGQLQRLALAGALARDPLLLLSDEATAMVDPEGRIALLRLLQEAARRRGAAVVHVTHFEEETYGADRHIIMRAGRVVSDVRPPARGSTSAERPLVARPAVAGADVVLRLDDVGFVHAPRTPWEHRVLDGLGLAVRRGEGVRIIGRNGAGKSTLARILAGLERPTAGTCTVDGSPAHRAVGRVGIAFQHPRLQLQRSRVASDIAAAAGFPGASPSVAERISADALKAVGLDAALGGRSVEALSGGQMRRVALAGVLARRPSALVLDEPLAGLDPTSRDALIETLVRLRDREGLAIVLITHDPAGSGRLCDRSLTLHDGRLT